MPFIFLTSVQRLCFFLSFMSSNLDFSLLCIYSYFHFVISFLLWLSRCPPHLIVIPLLPCLPTFPHSFSDWVQTGIYKSVRDLTMIGHFEKRIKERGVRLVWEPRTGLDHKGNRNFLKQLFSFVLLFSSSFTSNILSCFPHIWYDPIQASDAKVLWSVPL